MTAVTKNLPLIDIIIGTKASGNLLTAEFRGICNAETQPQALGVHTSES